MGFLVVGAFLLLGHPVAALCFAILYLAFG